MEWDRDNATTQAATATQVGTVIFVFFPLASSTHSSYFWLALFHRVQRQAERDVAWPTLASKVTRDRGTTLTFLFFFCSSSPLFSSCASSRLSPFSQGRLGLATRRTATLQLATRRTTTYRWCPPWEVRSNGYVFCYFSFSILFYSLILFSDYLFFCED